MQENGTASRGLLYVKESGSGVLRQCGFEQRFRNCSGMNISRDLCKSGKGLPYIGVVIFHCKTRG